MSERLILLRPGTVDDAPRVAGIWYAGWLDGHLGGVPEELVAVRTSASFRKRAAERVSDTTVATVAGSVAGFIMVVGDEVEQVYVAAEHRGSGVAQRLLSAAERLVADNGFEEAWLAVVASNRRARAFYSREGWTDHGPFDYQAYGEAGPIKVPAHRYTKRVSPGERGAGAPPDRGALRGRVAVVAGATRGAGRGIAAALGEGGATVICTGRTSTSRRILSDYSNRAETIEETAELVSSLGGTGIAAAVDHLDAGQVEGLAEQIRKDHGRIDVLVNDIWGGELLKGGPADWNKPIWEHSLEGGLRILRLAIDTHLITSHYLLPLLIRKPGGLLVEVTDGTAEYNASHYRLSVFYDLAKVAVNRLAFSQGHELEPHGATAVALTPGWLRSEMMLENFGVSEDNWRAALTPGGDPNRTAAPADFALSESPRYAGRAVAALAADPDRARWNGKSVTSGQLAREYGFTDLDGSRPDIWRFMTEVRDAGLDAGYRDYR
jgi:NAD(P)-dependent dehydrogenase (short-subunit alcohol dehydrogenase family)/ribosomal protein S18 acetylase RimI-like enzyme